MCKSLVAAPLVAFSYVFLYVMRLFRSCLFLLTDPLYDCLPGMRRLDYRNIFLLSGSAMLFVLVLDKSKQIHVPAKELLSQLAKQEGYELKWPQGPSFLDKPFALYEQARLDTYIFQWTAWGLFVLAMMFHNPYLDEDVPLESSKKLKGSDRNEDHEPSGVEALVTRLMRPIPSGAVVACGSFPLSRACVYAGSFFILASSMATSLPDYISAADLNSVLPHCAPQFDLMLHTVFRMIIGMCLP